MADSSSIARYEAQSMKLAMLGSLFAAIVGVSAGVLANSNAIMLDGYLSAIGFITAALALRLSSRIQRLPDKRRPEGYASEEAVFTTFRALTSFGLILFSGGSALVNAYRYFSRGEVIEIQYLPVIVHFLVTGLASILLWLLHRRNWTRTGRRSEILATEARAAAYDGWMTAISGAGLIGIYVLRDGALAPIAPIGDSLITLLLCFAVIGQFWKRLASRLDELMGGTAQPARIAIVRRAARPVLLEAGGQLVDLTVVKAGRTSFVTVFFNPSAPITGKEADELRERVDVAVQEKLPDTDVLLLITASGRAG